PPGGRHPTTRSAPPAWSWSGSCVSDERRHHLGLSGVTEQVERGGPDVPVAGGQQETGVSAESAHVTAHERTKPGAGGGDGIDALLGQPVAGRVCHHHV